LIIPTFFIILIVFYVVRFIIDFIGHLIGNYVSNTIGRSLRTQLRDKIEKLPIKYYDEQKTGSILSTFSNDVDTVTNSLQQSIQVILGSILSIVGVLFMMFYISWQMTLIALFTLPLYVIATTQIAKRSQSKFKRQQKELANLNGYIEEIFTAHKVVKLYGKEDDSFDEFQVINQKLKEEAEGAQFLSGMIRPSMDLISNFGYVLVVIIGGILAGAANPLFVGDIVTFISYQRSFVNPILNIASIANTLQSTIAGAERVFAMLDLPEEIQEQSNAEFETTEFRGEVVFDHVDFSYVEDKELIQDLNLKVESGKQIAIVGPTGAGKTTLVNLLMRFYEIQAGHISIDGVKSTDVPRTTLRKLFGMVLQDTWLFSGTIKENIAYGKDDATIDEVIDACKQAHVHHFIETMPQGYDTVLNEDASNISSGQKQLLTIARAILFNPKILILDEATSSVDTRTEASIQNAMNHMMQSRTSFVIAHRLSTIKNASVILVMQSGRIVEQGNHKDLLAKGGAYAELYNSQFLNPMV
ncbi:MAG: ABC transporter ATP-binding protein, partial [bacterium]|nr:ABC transporter ATP-binding protein [bacterium]